MQKYKIFIYKLLYAITRNKKYKYYINFYKTSFNYKNNKIVLINGNERKILAPNTYIKNFNIIWHGDNNSFEIELPHNIKSMSVSFGGNNNTFSIKKACLGTYNLCTFGDNNIIKIAERVESQGLTVVLHDNDKFLIGNNCMLSSDILCFTDGHSVIDKDSKDLLNKAPFTIEIGNHCWIGRNVSFLKSASIPDNCIVGMNSTVTKAFKENFIVIAGNPAKIVKSNINWNGMKPSKYDKNKADYSF